jgi:hypothetical protein
MHHDFHLRYNHMIKFYHSIIYYTFTYNHRYNYILYTNSLLLFFFEKYLIINIH